MKSKRLKMQIQIEYCDEMMPDVDENNQIDLVVFRLATNGKSVGWIFKYADNDLSYISDKIYACYTLSYKDDEFNTIREAVEYTKQGLARHFDNYGIDVEFVE